MLPQDSPYFLDGQRLRQLRGVCLSWHIWPYRGLIWNMGFWDDQRLREPRGICFFSYHIRPYHGLIWNMGVLGWSEAAAGAGHMLFFILNLIISWIDMKHWISRIRGLHMLRTQILFFAVRQDCFPFPIPCKLGFSHYFAVLHLCLWMIKFHIFRDQCFYEYEFPSFVKKAFIYVQDYCQISLNPVLWILSIFHIHLPTETISLYKWTFLKISVIEFRKNSYFRCTFLWLERSSFIS